LNADTPLAARLSVLEASFREVASLRMAGVPVLNSRLRVQAVGFAVEAAEPSVAGGVLVTPWFMNLLRLPLAAQAAASLLPAGAKGLRRWGNHEIEFIGAHENTIGGYEMSSLFSPMFEFADQAAAVATAQEVLALLRPLAQPARRGFLFGRSAAAA
jgi:[NiFe] hydrogenase assembly HybE family chaperone